MGNAGPDGTKPELTASEPTLGEPTVGQPTIGESTVDDVDATGRTVSERSVVEPARAGDPHDTDSNATIQIELPSTVDLPDVEDRDTTERPPAAWLAVPRLPWSEEARSQLHTVDVPDARDMIVRPGPGDPDPALAEGEVVDGRYEVLGCLAHGGLGWVYLAHDRQLDLTVALKGYFDSDDTESAEVERRALTELHHENIVRISGFAEHPRESGSTKDGSGDGRTGERNHYIIMEYAGGLSLRRLLQRITDGEESPLRPEHVIGYGLEILDAFHYLHAIGRHYCDMKPDNVVHGGNQIKIIDLGASRRAGETNLMYTPRFAPPHKELRQHGWTDRADLHTVGVTLQDLLAKADDSGATTGVESLRHVLGRATAPHDRRFASAYEMARHLVGVLREIQSMRDGKPRGGVPASVFAQTAALTDAGLGTVPALDRWTTRAASEYAMPPLHDGKLEPPEYAPLLPPPRPDRADGAAAFLGRLRSSDARGVLRQLDGAPNDTPELALARCRAHLELGALRKAADCVSDAARLLGTHAAHDWRLAWHHGLLELAESHLIEARRCFEAVHHALPGESVPKLALGYCHEYEREVAAARELYRAVWLRERDQAGAAFGLARLALADGDRAKAVRVLHQVPEVSLHYQAAHIAAVRVLTGKLGDDLPTIAELDEAAERLHDLELEGDDGQHAPARERLTAEVHETKLQVALASADKDMEEQARKELEQSVRTLAHQALNPLDHDVLTDLANLVRPTSPI